jgi:hypothetical protein
MRYKYPGERGGRLRAKTIKSSYYERWPYTSWDVISVTVGSTPCLPFVLRLYALCIWVVLVSSFSRSLQWMMVETEGNGILDLENIRNVEA